MRVPSSVVRSLIACAALLATPVSARASAPDHSAFSEILSTYVLGGNVNYGGLLQDRVPLDRYRSALKRTTQLEYDKWKERDQIAFWINLYNAETIALLLDHPNTKSIRSVAWFLGAFREQTILMPFFGQKRLSLNDIQDQMLRKKFREPRIHFALVGAAQGYGRLRGEAYTGDRLNEQLDDQARDYVREPKKAHWDAATNVLWLSKAFDWYRVDFEQIGGIVATVARYSDDATRRRLTSGPIKIKYLDYDWDLNGHW
jgi:hypothetical protein